MPLRQIAHGPTAAAPPDVLARLPRSSGGEPVPMGAWAMSEDEEDRHLVIEIDEFIGWWTTDKRVFKRAVKQARPDRITLRIASPGGFVDDALAIHDFVKDYAADNDVEVTVLVNALTASAATLIACCASPGRLRMSETALFLIHEPWGLAIGNRHQLARAVQAMERFSRVCVRVYERRTGLDRAAIEGHLTTNDGNGEWWDADEALALGYVDEVYVPGEDPSESEDASASASAGLRGRSPVAVASALGLPPLPAAAAARLAAPPRDPAHADEEAAPEDEPDALDPTALAALQESLGGLASTFTAAPPAGA